MNDKIITALDFDNFDEAASLVDKLNDAVWFKVGLQSFLSFGDELIQHVNNNNHKLFLDLKFKDIPNTVAGAVKASLKYNPGMLTIHMSGGGAMVKAAVDAAAEKEDLRVLGVTVLTSMSDEDLKDIGGSYTAEETVLRLVDLGLANGLNSFVCSPMEIEPIKSRFGKDVTLVTPGIRPEWSAKGDQKRVFTPAMAVEKGTDYMVIGRPITKNENPSEAYRRICEEIENRS